MDAVFLVSVSIAGEVNGFAGMDCESTNAWDNAVLIHFNRAKRADGAARLGSSHCSSEPLRGGIQFNVFVWGLPIRWNGIVAC